MCRAESIRTSVAEAAPVEAKKPLLAHLEAIDADGARQDFWCKLLEHAVQWGKSVGRVIARPPPPSLLADGGFGRIWRARDRRLGLVVAVKNVESDVGEQEVLVMSHLGAFQHPCILRLFYAEHLADVCLWSLCVEFCGGGDLLACISQAHLAAGSSGSYVAPGQSRQWLGQILLALEHLHFVADILHLDIKPANVLLDDTGRAKLGDFGASRIGAAPIASWTAGAPPGSPGYIAPEILAGDSFGHGADLYSLAALAFVLETGGDVSRQLAPMPPYSDFDEDNFEALLGDWQLLRAAARAARGTFVVGSEVCDFVLQLAVRNPDDRPSHEKLRASDLVLGLRLPKLTASADEVNAWLDDLSNEK